jgi:hypothetical protein
MEKIVRKETEFSGALYDLRERYNERFGPMDPIVSLLEPELLYVLLEMALDDEVEIDTASIEEALSEVEDRVEFFRELPRR